MGKLGFPDLSPDRQGEIIGMWRTGWGKSHIARELEIDVKFIIKLIVKIIFVLINVFELQRKTVRKYIGRFQEHGNVATLPRSGHPRVLDEATKFL